MYSMVEFCRVSSSCRREKETHSSGCGVTRLNHSSGSLQAVSGICQPGMAKRHVRCISIDTCPPNITDDINSIRSICLCDLHHRLSQLGCGDRSDWQPTARRLPLIYPEWRHTVSTKGSQQMRKNYCSKSLSGGSWPTDNQVGRGGGRGHKWMCMGSARYGSWSAKIPRSSEKYNHWLVKTKVGKKV